MALRGLLEEARGCTTCAAHLPLGPRPILSLARQARILLVGQAPGTAVHESGVPWDDPSGDHLREWLGLSRETFYGSKRIGIMPMGFCYPGAKKGGDAPPRAECAPLWHGRLRAALPDVELTLLIGRYAHAYYLSGEAYYLSGEAYCLSGEAYCLSGEARDLSGRAGRKPKSVTAAVRAYRDYLPELLPLPHPSWRSKIWMGKNPWFEKELLPELRDRVARLIG